MTDSEDTRVRRSMKRRDFIRASAISVAGVAATRSLAGSTALASTEEVAAEALLQSLPGLAGAGSNTDVRPFALHQVRLGDGLLKQKQDLLLDFARRYDERRMLMGFNDEAGRPNPPGLQRPGSWENDTQLRGHFAGHFLTLLAQSYAATGEQVFKDKLDWMVGELAECQAAITARMDNGGGEPEPPPPIGRVTGRFGNALRLNGPSNAQYVILPQEAVAQLSDFTIAAWVNLATTQNWTRVFDFGQSTAVNMFLTPRAGVTGTPPRFAITVGGSGQEQQINGTAALPTNTWVHLAVTLSGTTGRLFVNGEQVGINTNMTLNPSSLGAPANRWLGRSHYSDPLLNATVDEFHIFDHALSQAGVQSLLDSPAGTTGGGNIAWYRFDEDGGADALDSSSNDRAASIFAATEGSALWIPTHPGYLGAVPEDVVLRLGPPRFAIYGGDSGSWAPWYTQHKIMRGLLDAYYHTGNEQARDVVVTMADWAHLALTLGDINHPNYSGPITRNDLNLMWDTYIAGEYGGANEVFAEIYEVTGEDRHLETAKAFDHREGLFQACAQNIDILTVTNARQWGRRRPAAGRLHANQHIPSFVGYLRVYEQSDDDEYLAAAKNFFGMCVPHRMYAHGGIGGNVPGWSSNIEMFQNRGNIANSIADDGAETCPAYNLIKLARNLFFHEQNPSYIDYLERGLLNQIAGSRADAPNPSGTVTQPMVTYFQRLTPGGQKGGFGNAGTCCGGTGIENHTKYQESVYFRSANGSALYVNLFVSSVLKWPDRGFAVTQTTDFPREGNSRLTIDGSGPLDVKLRVPGWARKGFTVKVNGVGQKVDATPSSYVTISRNWQFGDVIEISAPMSVRIERAMDRPDTQSIFWGPCLLGILGGPQGQYKQLGLYAYLKRDGDYSRAAITPLDDDNFLFTTHGFTLQPWYVGQRPQQSPYFRRVEPEIVFGSITTGVPNYKRNDGLPDYDVPVSGIPSPGTDGLTFLDVVWDQAPFDTHGQFVSAVARTADEFLAAGLLTEAEKDHVVATASRARRELEP